MQIFKYGFLLIFLAFQACQSSQASTETTATESPVVEENTKKEEKKNIIKKLPPKAFQAQLTSVSSPLLLDVRTPKEFEAGHLDNALNINFFDSDFAAQVQNILEVKRPVFVYCKSGGRSGKASNILKDLGCQEIYDLAGGYTAWSKADVVVLPDTLKATTH